MQMVQDMILNQCWSTLLWLLNSLWSYLGVGGVLCLIAGGVFAVALSARAVKFFLSRRGMTVSAAVLMVGLLLFWYGRPGRTAGHTYGPSDLAYRAPSDMPLKADVDSAWPDEETEEEPAEAAAVATLRPEQVMPAIPFIPPYETPVPAIPPQQAPVYRATPIVNRSTKTGTVALKASKPQSSSQSRIVAAAPSARATPGNSGAPSSVPGQTSGAAQGHSALTPQQRLDRKWQDFIAGQKGLIALDWQIRQVAPSVMRPVGGTSISGVGVGHGAGHTTHPLHPAGRPR